MEENKNEELRDDMFIGFNEKGEQSKWTRNQQCL